MKIAGKALFPFQPFTFSTKPTASVTDVQLMLVKEFNQNITDNNMEFEEVPCLCGGTEFRLIASVDRYAMLQKTVLCTTCGLIQSNPRMTESQCRSFYTSDLYRRCYEGDDYIRTVRNRKYDDDSGLHIFDAINKIKKIMPGMTVIELGAGGGWNLLPFAKAGAKTLGIELSPSLVGMGREHGMEMIQGDVGSIAGIYDVVILNHVLEHLSDPIGALKNITEHMSDSSIIYIGVPNIMNFSMAQLQNAHMYYFTPWTFEYYCSRAGLMLITRGSAQKTHMFGIFSKNICVKCGTLKKHYLQIRLCFWFIKLKYYIKAILAKLGIKRADR